MKGRGVTVPFTSMKLTGRKRIGKEREAGRGGINTKREGTLKVSGLLWLIPSDVSFFVKRSGE